jgi:hypothetical protein
MSPLDRQAAAKRIQNARKIQPDSVSKPQVSTDMPLVEGSWVRVRASLLCPFGNRPMEFMLFHGSVRARGFAWLSKPFTREQMPAMMDLLAQRASAPEKTPATVYLKKCPWTGAVLELLKCSAGFEYRFPGLGASQAFRSAENARHWFSIRGGVAPIFGPDVIQAMVDHDRAGEDDGETVRREEQRSMDESMENLEERMRPRTPGIITAPGLAPKDSERPGTPE